MSSIQRHDTVGEIVARQPALAHAFEKAGIDYCCGGKRTLEEACRTKGIDPEAFLVTLGNAALANEVEIVVDAAAMTLTELADHIEQAHHAYLREELPRLDMLTQRVATAHGSRDARLQEVRDTLQQLAAEMMSHMMKEEQILFPMIRHLENTRTVPQFHCGSITNPIRRMEHEHQDAGNALEQLRTLTDSYNPPDWACNTYRAMLHALSRLERDMHQHVHKEDNVLFPKAARLEAALTEKAHA